MKLKNLLLLASIPFLLSPKLKAAENYSIVPDSSYSLIYPYPTERISGIYNGSYSLKPKEDIFSLEELKIESVKDYKDIKGEILNPIINTITNKYPGLEKLRPELENRLQNSITTDGVALSLFDTYFSDNNLSAEENYSLRLLLNKKTAIAFFMKEKHPVKNSNYIGYDEYPHILIFEQDSKKIQLDTTKLEQYIPPKDSVYTKIVPKKIELKTPEKKKKTWRDMVPK